MKVLFISAVLPYPLHSGGQIRIYNLLKRLSKKHEITLYAFIRSEHEKAYISDLSFCQKVVPVMRGHAWQASYITKSVFGTYPFLWETYHNARMEALLAEEVEKHDVVHIEPGYVWPSVPHGRTPVVLAEHNVEHEVYAKFAERYWFAPFLNVDVAKLKYWEKRAWMGADRITAVSERDAQEISRLSGKAVSVVPNGVDLGSFPFRRKKGHGTTLTFLFIGNFNWIQNRDAAGNIRYNYWPVIKKQYPDARLRIVGKGAPDGEISDVSDELARADILLAPIRIGGGTQFKILQAMASGLPVITTSLGAQGLPKGMVWIADTPNQMNIPAIMSDTKKIVAARKLIEERYNWDIIADTLEKVWQRQ